MAPCKFAPAKFARTRLALLKSSPCKSAPLKSLAVSVAPTQAGGQLRVLYFTLMALMTVQLVENQAIKRMNRSHFMDLICDKTLPLNLLTRCCGCRQDHFLGTELFGIDCRKAITIALGNNLNQQDGVAVLPAAIIEINLPKQRLFQINLA